LGQTSTNANGVKGTSTVGASAVYGYNSYTGAAAGTHGEAASSSGWGVYGYNSGSGVGTYGESSSGYGVFGVSSTGYAGYFIGNVYVTGSLAKGGGGFLIDHPLDPANRFCEHSFVESPERKNVYDGVGTADANGELAVELPAYFEALNTDFRYQLTALGGAAPDLHVKDEIGGGRFAVAGAKPGQRVSWQITGVRKDAWALANPLVAERDKPAEERGLFLHPEEHGAPAEKRVHAGPTLHRPNGEHG
jgi:hypothetical protein